MNGVAFNGKRKAILFGILAVSSFCACFILAPLGSFTVWITAGATLYFLFMTIYALSTPDSSPSFAKKRKFDAKQEEMRSYIQFHTRILIALFFINSFVFVLNNVSVTQMYSTHALLKLGENDNKRVKCDSSRSTR